MCYEERLVDGIRDHKQRLFTYVRSKMSSRSSAHARVGMESGLTSSCSEASGFLLLTIQVRRSWQGDTFDAEVLGCGHGRARVVTRRCAKTSTAIGTCEICMSDSVHRRFLKLATPETAPALATLFKQSSAVGELTVN